jgi:hypothetical protein
MSDTTPHLSLPLIAEAQAQKHITHNEALADLDTLVQLTVKDRDLAAPPASPVEGDAYIVASGATGDWAGHEGEIAAFRNGGWVFHAPQEGWRAWVADEDVLLIHDGSAWQPLSTAGVQSPSGAATTMHVEEEELSLSGAHVDSSIVIPNRAIVLGVSTRTTQAITGATSYDCGISSEPSKFGGSLGVAAGSTIPASSAPPPFMPTRLCASPPMAATSPPARCALPSITCCAPCRRADRLCRAHLKENHRHDRDHRRRSFCLRRQGHHHDRIPGQEHPLRAHMAG